jgi:hypothetical protein
VIEGLGGLVFFAGGASGDGAMDEVVTMGVALGDSMLVQVTVLGLAVASSAAGV